MSLVEVENLHVHYRLRGGWFRRPAELRAVNGVSFSLEAGETLGLVGESGCGKSTLGRALVRLERPGSGRVLLNGRDLATLSGSKLRKARREFQMIFQDPYGSLNPRLTIQTAIEEVLKLHTELDRAGRRDRVAELLTLVGLEPGGMIRYPHQFSGGQRQRIGIARALAAQPSLIIADEPVSALDVSVQAQIINLLGDIQRETGTAFLFIAHDLGVVEHVSRRIMVMYLGKIVEIAPARTVTRRPSHPYTRALLSAVPTLDAESGRRRIVLSGDVPSPVNPPSGCAFHPRCSLATERCRCETPRLELTATGASAACFHALQYPETIAT